MKNANERDVDEDDLPALHKAAKNGNENILRGLLLANKDSIEYIDDHGLTALIHATIAQKFNCMQILLENGANPNEKDAHGNTALMHAISKEWYDGIKLVLEHGAKSSTQESSRRNAVHLAICCKDTSILRLILRCSNFSDINQTDIESMTPAHWASFHNWADQLRMLLEAGGDPTIRDRDGKTALHWAAQNGSVACIQLLLTGTEDKRFINSPDLEGRAPIHLAAAAGHLDVVFELAQSPGCNTEARDREGRTALHWACAMNKERTVAGLLRLGVSYQAKDSHGATPLAYARQAKHNLCANLLLNYEPHNPHKTLIPVGSPIEHKCDVRSTQSKKMRLSETMDSNANVSNLHPFKGELNQGRTVHKDEILDNLNRAFDGIMTCEPDDIGTKSEVGVRWLNRGEKDKLSSIQVPEHTTNSASTALSPDPYSNGYSSDEDSRYPPQMAVSPPNMASPDMSESEDESFLNIHSNNAASVGVKLHRLVCKQSSSPASTTTSTPNYQLGPLRKKEVPEYLRVHSSSSENIDVPVLKTQTLELGPLKLRGDKQITNQTPTTTALTGRSSISSRESIKEPLSPSERPLGLRKKSMSLNQDLTVSIVPKGAKVLSRSKSYGVTLSKVDSQVLPSIKPRGALVKTTDSLFKPPEHLENGNQSPSLKVANEKKKKKSRHVQQQK